MIVSDRWAEAVELRAQGWSLGQIGKKLGVTREGVRQAFKARGIDTAQRIKEKPPKLPAREAFDWSEAIRWREEGMATADIAARLGMRPAHVLRNLKARGVDTSRKTWSQAARKKQSEITRRSQASKATNPTRQAGELPEWDDR